MQEENLRFLNGNNTANAGWIWKQHVVGKMSWRLKVAKTKVSKWCCHKKKRIEEEFVFLTFDKEKNLSLSFVWFIIKKD